MCVCVYVCMCVCVYVCMYVCMSGGLPPDPHKPSPQNLAWAPHFTWARHRVRGRPQMLTPGGTPYSDSIWKTLKVKNWVGASKQKLLLGVGLPSKILFVGGSPKTGACRVHPSKWGCMLWELGGGQQTKVAPGGGFVYKIFILGGSPQPKARRVLRLICTGLFHNEIVK
jgi:hypothetical protein